MTSVAPRERRLVGSGRAAEELGIDPATLWRWEQRGLVTPTTRTIGGQARWDLDELREQVRAAYEQGRGQEDGPPFAPGLADAPRHPEEPDHRR